MAELHIGGPGGPAPSQKPKVKPLRPKEEDDANGADDSQITHAGSKLKSFSSLGQQADFDFQRPMNTNGSGATRCRLFHSKIADAPLKVMETHINEWLDAEGIEVKSTDACIGAMQGKSTEPNVIVLIWY